VRELAGLGAHVTGCDFSLAALVCRREKTPRIESLRSFAFVQGDAQALPFADQSFDIVVSCETFEHRPEVQTALREMWRVTRPGGKFFPYYPQLMPTDGLYELYARVRHPRRKDDQHSIAGSGFCKFAGG